MTTLSGRHIWLGAVAGTALVVIVWVFWPGRGTRSTDDAFVDGDVVTVSAQVPGVVQSVTVADNGYVHAHTPLLELDPDDLRLQLDAAQASRDIAKAQFDEAKASVVGDGGAATARRRGAEAALQLASVKFHQAELALDKAHVTAPTNGYVAHRMVSAGDTVQIGQPLVALVTGHLWITANLKETQLNGVKPGDPADVTIDAFPNLKFKAHVESLQQGAGQTFSLLPPENASGNFVKVVQRVPVRLVFDRLPNQALAPGLSARVRIHVR